MKILKTFENFNVPSKGRWQSYKENLSSDELKLQSKDFTYDTYNQWKDSLADEDEINLFKKLADKVHNGATTKEKFNQLVARGFNTMEWKNKPEIKQSQSEKTPNELPKSNQSRLWDQPKFPEPTTLEEKIENLTDEDLKGITMNVRFNVEDVDKQKVDNDFLEILKKLNLNITLDKIKNNIVRTNLSYDNDKNFYKTLWGATQKGWSPENGLKEYFLDNMEIFK